MKCIFLGWGEKNELVDGTGRNLEKILPKPANRGGKRSGAGRGKRGKEGTWGGDRLWPKRKMIGWPWKGNQIYEKTRCWANKGQLGEKKGAQNKMGEGKEMRVKKKIQNGKEGEGG